MTPLHLALFLALTALPAAEGLDESCGPDVGCLPATQADAEKALALLPTGAEYVSWCQTCECRRPNQPPPPKRVTSSSVARVDAAWTVVVNGVREHPGHLFVKRPDGSFKRLTAVLGCVTGADVPIGKLDDFLVGHEPAKDGCAPRQDYQRLSDGYGMYVEVPVNVQKLFDRFGPDAQGGFRWDFDSQEGVRLSTVRRFLPQAPAACVADERPIVTREKDRSVMRKTVIDGTDELTLELSWPAARDAQCAAIAEHVGRAFGRDPGYRK